MVTVWASGVPLRSLGYVGDVSWSHRAVGGCWEASWQMAGLAKSVAHPLLRRGAPVKITVGGWPVWAGVLDEPGASMESFTARGLSREAERFMALDSTGAPTYSPSTAITQAIARGLPWTYTSGAPTGVASDKAEYLHQLLDVSATAASQRWGVGADGVFYSQADPTSPTYHAFPADGVMGQADDEYATDLKGRYVSAMSGTPPVPSAWAIAAASDATAADLYGRVEHFVDLTPRGLLTASEAGNILAGMLALGRARVGFTERLEIDGYRLMTAKGGHAPLPFVTAGGMVRVHGAISPGQSATGETFLDFIIGETTYQAGARSISLAPVGLAPRTLADVLAVTAVEERVA